MQMLDYNVPGGKSVAPFVFKKLNLMSIICLKSICEVCREVEQRPFGCGQLQVA